MSSHTNLNHTNLNDMPPLTQSGNLLGARLRRMPGMRTASRTSSVISARSALTALVMAESSPGRSKWQNAGCSVHAVELRCQRSTPDTVISSGRHAGTVRSVAVV